MATALIVLDGDGSKVLGAWVPKGAGLDAAWRGTTLQYRRADSLAHACPAALSWDDYCQQLAERTPVALWWETKQVDDGTTAAQVLAEQVNRQFSK
jgi:hypothetical protein